MLISYFKIAWRNLLRNKIFSVIKILGLSLGLAVCMLIFLYTKDEISYDQFQENKTQLFRIIQTWNTGKESDQTIGTTNAIVGQTFAKEIPEVQECIHVNGGAPVIIKNHANDLFTEYPLFVDESFLSVFTFPVLEGDKKTALKDLYSVVLSEDFVKKYFSQQASHSIIGKTIQLKINEEFESFTVTAIIKNTPQNSTLKAGMLLPFMSYERYNDNQEWLGGSMNTFLLLSPHANVKAVENKMQILFDLHTKSEIAKIKQEKEMTIKIKLALQPLTSIHLSKKAGPDNGMSDGSKPSYSYILTCIAIFILVIACINFINLAIAQSLRRAKEIGVRKVVGSTRTQLIKQFLAESLLVSSIAFAIAIVLTAIALPFFNELANKKLSLSYLSDGPLYVGMFLLLLFTSFVAGFYPSLVLSSFQPVKVLYSKQKLLGKNYFTKALIVLQFGLAIFLVIATIAINSQLRFLSNASLGYDSKNLVRILLPVRKSSDKLPDLFKNELTGQQNILGIAAKNDGRNISGVKVDGKLITLEKTKIDYSFLSTFKIPVIAGRNFSPKYPSDVSQAVLVNETFLKEAGWQVNSAVGKTVNFLSGDKKTATIVGVIKDYHFVSLKEKIMPQLLTLDTNFNYGQLWVKIGPDNIPHTLASLQKTFRKIVPYFPYSFQFMDNINAKYYETEAKWKQIIWISSGLFLFISCIGLLGLAILSVEQRTKEIGIRKVLGAATYKIILLISKEFVALVCVAYVIALPVSYYAIDKWLQNFAFKISIGWWIFVAAGAIALLSSLATISFQAVKAALANPVMSLRTE